MKNKKRVGVLRGGARGNYARSLRRGGELIAELHNELGESWKVFDILIDKDDVWHLGGRPIRPADLLAHLDIVWNITHPSYGVVLQNLNMSVVGPSVFAGALAESRAMLKEQMKKVGISLPGHFLLPAYQKDFDGSVADYALKSAQSVHGKFSAPWIVKAFNPGANLAIHLAKTFPELVDAIIEFAQHDASISVEEFISGRLASVHTVGGFRGEVIYVLPVANPSASGSYTRVEKEKMTELARTIHGELGVPEYLRSDFIINSRGKIFLFNLKLHPELDPDSTFRKSCEVVGTKAHHVLEHILIQAL